MPRAFLSAILAVSLGSIIGGLIRWYLSMRFNNSQTIFPLGTLAANLIACYLIGLFLGFFLNHPDISPQWKLLLTTGVCGGLSTFSTFSAEMVFLLQQQRYLHAFSGIAIHVSGSLLLTALGFLTWHLFKR